MADDTKGTGETDEDFRARTQKQEAYFQTIQALHGFHLRLGTLTGSRPRLRQKEVDVQLAVDMLTHGFSKNMNRAVLVAGDLDFRPIVDALISSGVFVEVWYEKASAAKDLFWAADFGRELTSQDIYYLTDPKFRNAQHLPQEIWGGDLRHQDMRLKKGTTIGKEIYLVHQGPVHKLFLPEWNGNGFFLIHNDPDFLERYFTVFHAPIAWSQ